MSLFDRISTALRSPGPDRAPFADLRRPPAVRAQPTVALYRYGKATWPSYTLERGIRFYDQVVVAFACVNLIADAAATAPVRVYDAEGGELPEHPLRALLRRPNHYLSEAEWLNAMVKTAAVCGFAVSEIERGAGGRPVGLHPLRPDWLAPIPRRDNLMDWQYQIPGGDTVTLRAEDVLDWTYQGGPLSPQLGITPLLAAGRELSIDLELTDFVKAFFDSGAVPQLGLIPEEGSVLEQGDADVLKEKFRAASGTPWEPIVMQAIRDVKRLGFDLNEMAYKDLRALTSTEICTAFRVPPVMLGTLVGLENSPWSKYEEARKSFYEDTITPLWARLDGALTRSLLPEFEINPGVSLEFDTSAVPALQEDQTQTWSSMGNPAIQKLLTVNEARGELGFPPLAGGDVRLLTLADVEVPAIALGQRSNGHMKFAAADLGSFTMEEHPEYVRDQPDPLAAGGNGHHQRLRDAMALVSGHPSPFPAETRASVAQNARQTMLRLGKRAEPLLARFWAGQGERVLAGIGLGRAAQNGHPHGFTQVRVSEEALDWAAEDQRLAAVLHRVYGQAGRAAFGAARELLGVEIAWDLANPALGQLTGQLLQRASGINATTRDQLETLITESLSAGVTLPELSTRITAQFAGYSAGRAAVTGRTESQVAYNLGSRIAYQESGLVEEAELHDNPEHGGYGGDGDGLTCAERNGLQVPLAEVDRHVLGTHPNCILAVAPILATALGEE